MGDIHGDVMKTLQALVKTGLLTKVSDTEYTWQASAKEGEAIVYFAQTGDIFDRGDFGDQVAALLHADGEHTMTVGDQKIKINGKIPKDYLLLTLGNHDAFPLLGMDISHGQFYPRGLKGIGFKPILECDGELRQLLKGTPIVRIFGDTVFLHGGISLEWAGKAKDVYNKKEDEYTTTTECTADGGVTVAECTISGNELIRNLNEAAMSILWNKDDRYCPKDDTDLLKFFTNRKQIKFFDNTNAETFLGNPKDPNVLTMLDSETCPLWYRGWTGPIAYPGHKEYPVIDQTEYAETLALLKAKRMVMGHSIIMKGITLEYEGTLIGIDVGQSYFFEQIENYNSLQLLKIEYDGPDAKKKCRP